MFYPELEGDALTAYEGMCAELKTKAMKQLGLGPDQVIIRPLKATDIGLDDVTGFALMTTGTAAGAAGWTSSEVDTTISTGRWVGIHGLQTEDGAASLTQVRIQREGSDARYWDVSQIPGFNDTTGYVDDPITIAEETKLNIKLYGRTASTLYDTQFLGAVAEKRGITINP